MIVSLRFERSAIIAFALVLAFIFFFGFVVSQTAPNPGHVGSEVNVIDPTTTSESDLQTALDNLSNAGGGGGFWTQIGSDIYYNDGSVGIGTASPSPYTLKVVRDDGDPTNHPSIRLSDGGALGSEGFIEFAVDPSNNLPRIVSGSGAGIWFKPANLDTLYLSGLGKVGIGETSPDKPLHISGISPDIKFDDTVGDDFIIGNSDGAFRVRNVSAGTTDFYIDGDGKVGIGTTSPGALLHVVNSNLDGSQDYPLMARFQAHPGAGFGPRSLLEIIGFKSVTQTLIRAAANYGNEGSALVLDTIRPDGSYNSNQLYLDRDGKVGVGTNDPLEKLHVAGKVRGTELCIGTDCRSSWPAGGGGTITGGGTTNYIPKWTGGTSLGDSIIFDNGSSVGIGTVNPQQVLHVNGPIAAKYEGIYFTDGVAGTGNIGIGARESDTLVYEVSGVGSHVWKLGGAEGMRFNSQGLTISGLTSCDTIDTDASGKLQCGTDATGGGNQNLLQVLSTGADASSFGSPVRIGTSGIYLSDGVSSNNDGMRMIANNTKLSIALNNGDAIVVTSGNTVGINTVNPDSAYKLEVGGKINSTSQLCIQDSCRSNWPLSATSCTRRSVAGSGGVADSITVCNTGEILVSGGAECNNANLKRSFPEANLISWYVECSGSSAKTAHGICCTTT